MFCQHQAQRQKVIFASNSQLVPNHSSVSSNLSDANNDFSVLNLNTIPIKHQFEKMEALITSLESQPNTI